MNKEEYTELEIPKEYKTTGVKEPVWVHSTSHFEMMENVGALRWIDGADYPMKGIPTPEKLYGVNIMKSLIREGAKFAPLFIFVNKNKVFKSFNTITNRILKSTVVDHITVPHQYLCATAHGVYSIIANFLVNIGVEENIAENTGYNIAHIFEHDDAWRYRLQDFATLINISDLHENPAKELERAVREVARRQAFGGHNPISERLGLFIKPIKLVMLVPKYRNAFLNVIRFIKEMEYDDADWYWVCARNDYDYGGLTIEERSKDKVFPKQYLMG